MYNGNERCRTEEELRLPTLESHSSLALMIRERLVIDPHTRHDGPLRKVPREEVVVDCHTLVSNGVLLLLPLDDSVNQQERISGSIHAPCGIEPMITEK